MWNYLDNAKFIRTAGARLDSSNEEEQPQIAQRGNISDDKNEQRSASLFSGDRLNRLIGLSCFVASQVMIKEGFDKLCWLRSKFPAMPAALNGDQGFIDSFLFQCGIKQFRLIE